MTSKDTMVSILVPVYGTEAYLPACIDSIRNQSYTNIQIILVDDQSPDGCPAICDCYAQLDPRITVIHQENKGVSGARNTGMNHADGDYIMFVDSDDEIYPDAVEMLLQDAVDHGADIVWAPQKQPSRSGYEDGAYTIFQNEETLILSLDGGHNTGAVWGKLFKTAFIRGLVFEEGKNINEDGFYMFECYMKKPLLVQHNVPVYQYNTRVGSASRQKFSEKYLAMLYFCERKKELIAEYYPQYTEKAHNMEVRTNLLLLDVLCSTTERKHRALEKQCAKTVRRLYQYHSPINNHHKMLAWVVAHGLYPLYKMAVRMKYYRKRKKC